MEKITYKKTMGLLRSKVVLTVLGGFILSSCGATMGGYTETDGVYYDPNKDIVLITVITIHIMVIIILTTVIILMVITVLTDTVVITVTMRLDLIIKEVVLTDRDSAIVHRA